MKQRIILMMLLISGVLFSCGKTIVEKKQYVETVFENQTSYSVVLTGFSKDASLNGKEWHIDPFGHLNILNELTMGPSYYTPSQCDSVLVTFDENKNIVVLVGEGFFSTAKIEELSDNHKRYTYYISTELYDLAE